MNEILIGDVVDEWFCMVAEPVDEETSNLNTREKGHLQDLFGSSNEIWLGKPQAFDVTQFLQGKSQTLNFFSHDYKLLQIPCSFRPASNCEFIRASVKINIKCEDESKDAIALDMFPDEVFLPITYKRGISVNPNLKIEMTKVLQAEVSAFNYENSQEYIIYQPEITAYAKGTNTPIWDFNKTSNRPLRGNKDLFLLIEKPKDALALISLEITNCQVRTAKLGIVKLPRFFVKNTKKPVLEKVYALT